MKRILTIIGFCVLGLVVTFVLNFFILERLIIPDPCYYHSHDTNKIFDLFYELTAGEGFHPTPTILNLVLTLTAGIIVGLVLGIRRTSK
ncbi:MAG: hypothetical protein KBG30_11650 [Bacteroidales bacterium]|jgi:hypothetical protein|nr:hypothetical protein [Bacteroidales bacterium]